MSVSRIDQETFIIYQKKYRDTIRSMIPDKRSMKYPT